MELDQLHEVLRREDERIAREAQEAECNELPRNLPLELAGPGEFRFLPASSIAVQALVPVQAALHDALLATVASCKERVPELSTQAFWQPPGTFHLNLVILKRLSREGMEGEREREILKKAAPLLDELDRLGSYEVEFHGIRVRRDGCVFARGLPRTTAPWAIRRHFAEQGFPDQQGLFHITLGRILHPFPPTLWRDFVAFTETGPVAGPLGTFRVQEALLVSEAEGFLHTPACYRVLRRFRWDSDIPETSPR